MDRNAIIGFVLIGLVLAAWMWMNAPTPQQQTGAVDTSAIVHKGVQAIDTSLQVERKSKGSISAPMDSLGRFFSSSRMGTRETITIETDRYRAGLSTLGGSVSSWILKKFKTWDQYPVNLIDNDTGGGDFHLLFTTVDGKLIDTRGLYFSINVPAGQKYTLGAGDSLRLDFVLAASGGGRIVKTLIFYGDRYSFDCVYRFEGMENIIANFEYQVTWENGLRYVEHNSINESNSAMAYAFAGGELTDLDANKFNEPVNQNISGRVAWIATRNKYFAMAIIPREKESQGAYLGGVRLRMPDEGAKENYNLALRMPFTGKPLETDRFTVFLGPLDFNVVKSYGIGLDKVMSLGAAWIIRPISEYAIIPLFQFLRYFIPNYGFVLIVFSLIIKVVLYPLTRTSMKSMQKMQALQPMMNEIREKYKDDPQKMNQQVMRLYKEYGVNPAGGCLPMLLQLPILYALWAVFGSAVELRQASFVWWIKDLSVQDVVARLPFRLPIVNINEISGLALLMGVTMFVQQKMSVKDPRQKATVWMMPILFTLMFNGFPSGLNLYYFVFNLLSIAQQAWVNKQHKGEPLRKVEEKKKKGGVIGKLSANLAASTQRKK